MRTLFPIAASVLLLGGCAATPPTKIGADTYYASKTNSAGVFGSVSATAGTLIKESTQFCAQQGKDFEMAASHVTPMALGSLGDASITFRCVAQVGTPAVRPDSGVTTVQGRQGNQPLE